MYAEDIDWYVPGYPVPHERYRGRKAVAEEFFPTLRSHFATWRAEAKEFLESGERVTVIGRYLATTKDGRELVIPFLHVWTVRNDELSGVIAITDSTQFARAGISS